MSTSPTPLHAIRAACLTLEQAVRVARAATEDQLAAVRPVKRTARQWDAWWRYHERLVRWQCGGGQALHADGPTTASADLAALAALGNEPVTVCVGKQPDGSPHELVVYPKGPRALLHMSVREAVMRDLGRHLRALHTTREAPLHADLLVDAADEIDYQLRCLVWTATTPGARLPYERGARRPQPPAAIAELSPAACTVVQRAAIEVNWRRNRVLEALVAPPESDGERPTWSVFASTVASEFGLKGSDLLDDWTMGELLGQRRLAGEGARQAHEAAKAAAERERAGGA